MNPFDTSGKLSRECVIFVLVDIYTKLFFINFVNCFCVIVNEIGNEVHYTIESEI